MIELYKTSEELMGDFCSLMKTYPFSYEGASQTIADLINGDIYQDGFRPRESEKEDAVVIYTSGVTTGDIVKGEMTINLYVPDLNPFNNGVYVKDSGRITALAKALQMWLASLRYGATDYRIIQLEPLKSVEDRDLHQHFLVAHLQYEYCLTN